MKLIIGTYRKQQYLPAAIESIYKHVTGISKIVFVDDSGDVDTHLWELEHGDVMSTGKSGYNAAMKAVCEAAGDEPFCFWEEDFRALEAINLDELGEQLAARPHLAQLALLRGPWFPIEHEHGGLIEALEAKGEQFDLIDGVLEQTATFTCNPSIWQAGVAAAGWPDGEWSEERKRDELLAAGYKFGFVPGIKVTHEGIRSGFGY